MTRRLLALLLAILLAAGFAPVTAQDVAPPEERPEGVLAEFEVAELPTPHAEVWFVRMQLEPGGLLPEGTQIGPVVIYIEAGELVLETDVPIEIATAGPAVPETATPETGHRAVLRAGDSASAPAGAVMAARNDADAPVTFLVVMMYAAELEGTMMEDTGEPVGLTQSLLSAGGVEFPPIPGVVTIERIPLSQAEPTVLQNMAGIELGVVERGRAEVTFTDFNRGTLVWPGMMNEYAESEIVFMSGGTTLREGDGYSTSGTVATWIVMEEPVEILRVTAGPPIGR